MDEVAITFELFFDGNVSPEELQEIHDRLAELMEAKADRLFRCDAELVDYEIAVTHRE